MATRRVQFQYTASDTGFQAVSKRVGSSLDGLSRRGLNLTNLFKLGAGTFALAQVGQGVGALASSLVNAFKEQEDSVASLNAALQATGKTGRSAFAELNAEASRLQRITRAGDEAILKASASLATLVPSLDVAGLKNAQTALVALADTFFDGNLDTAALQLGKTLGSTTNALARYGIQIENSTAPASEKLAEILGDAKLKGAFEVAQARAQTFGGSLVQLTNAQGDLRESLASVVVEAFDWTRLNQRLTARIQSLTTSMEENRGKWVAWGQVVAAWTAGVASSFRLIGRTAFNLVTILGRVGFALGSLAQRDFAGVRAAVAGIRTDFGDINDAVGDYSRKLIQYYNSFFLATQGINTSGEKAAEAAGAIRGLSAAASEVGAPGPLQKLNQALDGVVARFRLWGAEIDVVAEKRKLLRAEIDRQLAEGATLAAVQPLIEQLRAVRGEWELGVAGAAAFRQELLLQGAAGAQLVPGLSAVKTGIARTKAEVLSLRDALERGLVNSVNSFSSAFLVSLDRIEFRFGQFVDSLLSQLSRAFSGALFTKLIGLAFGTQTAGFGSLFLSGLGLTQGKDRGFLAAAAAAPTGTPATVRVHMDVSGLPRSLDPRQAARDGALIQLVIGAVNHGLANGYRIGKRL
ncbi:MAG: hypothetical protein R3E10_02715 [Gemmatimonadota bacterium]